MEGSECPNSDHLYFFQKCKHKNIIKYLVFLLLDVTKCNEYNHNKSGLCLERPGLHLLLVLGMFLFETLIFLSLAWSVGYGVSW